MNNTKKIAIIVIATVMDLILVCSAIGTLIMMFPLRKHNESMDLGMFTSHPIEEGY